MTAEARIAGRFGHLVRAGGGSPAGAEVAATQLIADGATLLVSFGLAGGLDPALRPGAVIIPSVVLSDDGLFHTDAVSAERFGGLTSHTILACSDMITNSLKKYNLHATTRAHAVDLESGAVGRVADAHRLPFIVIRAICDPAERDLPPAAVIALEPNGSIAFRRVLYSVIRQPRQISGLLALARDAKRARSALVRLTRRPPTAVP